MRAKTKLLEDEQKIASLKSSIAKAKEDVKTRVDTYSENRYSMTVGKKTYTDKKEAGAALALEIIAKAKTGEFVTVGKFAGFEIRVIKQGSEYVGHITGAQSYKFNVYLEKTTYMATHIASVVEGIDGRIEAWNEALKETQADLAAQQKMIAEPFAKQAELDRKTARFNEIMDILNPKEEQIIGDEEDAVQYQAREKLDDDDRRKYSKRSVYSETETLFLQWSNGSAPVGEVKRFYRFGKVHYYEKTSEGCVELSRAQYNERIERNAENAYTRVQRQVNGTADKNEYAKGNLLGRVDGNTDAGGAEILSGYIVGEELRNDAGGSISGGGRNDNGVSEGINERYLSEVGDGDITQYSERVTDEKTLNFLNRQKTVKTYKSMQLIDGKLYPPMAAVVGGSLEEASELGKWEQAVEHPELIKIDKKTGKPKFNLNKGKGQGVVPAAYNPYMHSSNLVLNDQFTAAYKRNLVTVECEVPVSELTSGYKAQYAKDAVGEMSWHAGPVASSLPKSKSRKVILSRWLKPVRIVPDSEVAKMYAELLVENDIAVPNNVVTPSLLAELEKAGVRIDYSGIDKLEKRSSVDRQNQERSSPLTDHEVLEMAAEGIEVGSLSEAEKNALDIFNKRLSDLAQLQEERAELGRQYKPFANPFVKMTLICVQQRCQRCCILSGNEVFQSLKNVINKRKNKKNPTVSRTVGFGVS